MDEFLNSENIIKKCNFFVGAKVADFGCGHGHLSLLIAKEVGQEGRIYAFDVLDEALEGILNKAEIFGFKNIEAKKANLALSKSTGLRDKSVDFVLAANMLFQNSDKDKEAILKEAYRILKSDAKLIVVDWAKHAPFGPSGHKVDIEKIKDMAFKIGFKIHEIFNAGMSHWGAIFIK